MKPLTYTLATLVLLWIIAPDFRGLLTVLGLVWAFMFTCVMLARSEGRKEGKINWNNRNWN